MFEAMYQAYLDTLSIASLCSTEEKSSPEAEIRCDNFWISY